jgi:hypothetical protein
LFTCLSSFPFPLFSFPFSNFRVPCTRKQAQFQASTAKIQSQEGAPMKARILSITALALLFASAAAAQTKISGQQQCPNSDPVATVAPGDKPGHTMALVKVTCTWGTPLEIAGAKSKDGTSYAFSELTSTRITSTGTYVASMDNGDMFSVNPAR